jgi:hypothetical protein
MKRDPLVTQDALTASIITFLDDNAGSSYTIKELASEHYRFSSTEQLQTSISALLRKGLIKVKPKGSEMAYQIVLGKKASQPKV